MIEISEILGNIFSDNEWKEKYEIACKTNNIETVKLVRSDLEKTRLRTKSDKNTDFGIVLKSVSRMKNGDVLISNSEKLVVIQQMPEKVISVKIKENEANFEEILVILGHIIGNRHRPIQIENEKIIFPILSESELEIFEKLFSDIINQIEMKIEERVFYPQGNMDVHEH